MNVDEPVSGSKILQVSERSSGIGPLKIRKGGLIVTLLFKCKACDRYINTARKTFRLKLRLGSDQVVKQKESGPQEISDICPHCRQEHQVKFPVPFKYL